MSYNNVEDYVKNAENNRNTAVLNSLLESEPGMKELPEITPEDEGKILQVNNGSPSWSNGSSGGGVLVVNVIPEGEKSATMDKTWQEIYDAPFSVARVQTGPTSAMLCQICDIRQQNSDYYVSIIFPIPDVSNMNFEGRTFHAESANDYPTTGK